MRRHAERSREQRLEVVGHTEHTGSGLGRAVRRTSLGAKAATSSVAPNQRRLRLRCKTSVLGRSPRARCAKRDAAAMALALEAALACVAGCSGRATHRGRPGWNCDVCTRCGWTGRFRIPAKPDRAFFVASGSKSRTETLHACRLIRRWRSSGCVRTADPLHAWERTTTPRHWMK